MNKKTHPHFGGRAIGVYAILTGAFFVVFVFSAANIALASPTGNPPSGSGVISVSGSNVGIGATTPRNILEIRSASDAEILLNREGAWGTAPEGLKFTSNDADTDYWTFGMQPDTTNNIYLNRNGTNYFTVKDGGNVGIATTSPASTFAVNGNALITGTLSSQAVIGTISASNVSAGTFGSGGGNFAFPAALTVTGNVSSSGLCLGGVCNTTWPNNSQWTSSSTAIYYNGGNVGIGTTSPVAKLYVSGTSLAPSITADNGMFGLTSAVGTQLEMGTAVASPYASWIQTKDINNATNVYPLALNPVGGNVGIGTTSPGSQLTVSGAQGTGTPVTGGGALFLNDTTNAGGAGGAALFGYLGLNFAGIKGSVANGSGNSIGSLGFYTRVNTTDPNLTQQMTILSGGNVGIGTASPAYTLDVNGVGNFNSNVIHNVGTPLATSDAATKNYVDTVVGGGGANGSFGTLNVTGNWNISGAAQGGLNLNNYNISGVNSLTAATINVTKINATTIDPVYQIGDTKYATFAPSTIGVNEGTTGEGTLTKAGSDYEYAINFSKLAKGSDLWVWYQAVDFGKDTVNAIATPYGQFAEIYYTISGSTLTFHGNAPAQFSFNLTGKRFDWQKWPTQIIDQSAPAGFVLQVKN